MAGMWIAQGGYSGEHQSQVQLQTIPNGCNTYLGSGIFVPLGGEMSPRS